MSGLTMDSKDNVCKVVIAHESPDADDGSQKSTLTGLTDKGGNKVQQDNNILFYKFITDAMLHLYLTVAYSKQHMGVVKRNVCLSKFFKQAAKNAGYKPVKSDIKGLIHYGRVQGVNLEQKMDEILSLTEKYTVSYSSDSDMALFTKLLEEINKHCHLNADFFDDTGSPNDNRLYLDKRNVEGAFDATGKWINQIMLLLPKKNVSGVKALVEKQGWRCVLSNQSDNEEHQVWMQISLGKQ